MAEVEVTILRGGSVIDCVRRPLRDLNGKPAVTYRRQLRLLTNGCEVHLDDAADAAAPAEPVPANEPYETNATAEDRPVVWDDAQKQIINAPSDARLLIDAGPGTGKTAVACARVAALIDAQGIQPGKIWLISFTRTAVREIRDRIAVGLSDPSDAYGLKIATLDAHAWTLHSGFDDQAVLTSYDHNIGSLLQLIAADENLREYLQNIEHLIVDEAQDIVGIRAELVTAILGAISPTCGVSVFADEAQAIYGFSSDEDGRSGACAGSTLPQLIRKETSFGFAAHQLVAVHRTAVPALLEIFTETRQRILDTSIPAATRFQEARADITRLAHGKVPTIENQSFRDGEKIFVLFRRRSDVLFASAFLANKPHRIRMSGLPVCIAPWIGAALSSFTAPDIDANQFAAQWDQSVAPNRLASCPREEAWQHLVRLAGRSDTVVDLRRLRQQLGRRQPPPELCTPEIGDKGPIVGTIHASKGREADTVHLMLPAETAQESNLDEEARVTFVAATRGRRSLMVGNGFSKGASRVERSGRAYRIVIRAGQPRVQFEVGHDGDIEADGVASRSLYPTADDVRQVQTRLLNFAENIVQASAEAQRGLEFRYRLTTHDGQPLVFLEKSVNDDLFDIGKIVSAGHGGGGRRRPPDTINNLRIMGIRTIVLAPDSPEAGRLHAPWCQTGIMLAPVILGFTTAPLPQVKG